MTLSEFNERTNAHLTEDQYKPVENMYNEAGNIQKDQFCADWKSTMTAYYSRSSLHSLRGLRVRWMLTETRSTR